MPVLKDSKSHISTDPLRNFKYHVNIHHTPSNNRLVELGFMNMSGLAATTEPIPYREGGNNTTQRKMPGQTSFSDITLSRGVTLGSPQAWDWMLQMFSAQRGEGNGPPGTDFRCTIDVHVLAHPVTKGNTPGYAKFKIYNAWLSGLAFSELDAGGNAVYVEQLTIVHEGYEYWLAGGVRGNVYGRGGAG